LLTVWKSDFQIVKIGRAGGRCGYRLAASRTASLPERNYLTTKAARLANG
jgi:hypothetical protein